MSSFLQDYCEGILAVICMVIVILMEAVGILSEQTLFFSVEIVVAAKARKLKYAFHFRHQRISVLISKDDRNTLML